MIINVPQCMHCVPASLQSLFGFTKRLSCSNSAQLSHVKLGLFSHVLAQICQVAQHVPHTFSENSLQQKIIMATRHINDRRMHCRSFTEILVKYRNLIVATTNSQQTKNKNCKYCCQIQLLHLVYVSKNGMIAQDLFSIFSTVSLLKTEKIYNFTGQDTYSEKAS